MRPWCKGVNIGGMGRGRHCEKGEHESRLVAMKRHAFPRVDAIGGASSVSSEEKIVEWTKHDSIGHLWHRIQLKFVVCGDADLTNLRQHVFHTRLPWSAAASRPCSLAG
jgi:hypothetical protein